MPIPGGVAPVIAINDRGRSSGGSLTTLVDASKNWPIDVWKGASINLFLGDVLCTKCIVSNTSNSISFPALSTPIALGIEYFIVSTNILADGASVIISGTADVVITSQVAGIYLQPEWAAKEGFGKMIWAEGLDKAWAVNLIAGYTVPANKELYITNAAGASVAHNAADGDKPQQCYGGISIAGTPVGVCGGNGGFSIAFTTPVRAVAAEFIQGWIWNHANHNVDLYVTLTAYEVSV